MKWFVFRFGSFFVLSIGLMLIVTFCVKDDMSALTYMAGIQGKDLRIRTLPGPRIIFVGGSNLAYGINSPEIERELGHPVVNMGLHAGLGLCYHLETCAPFIHAGDLVVVVPEWEQYLAKNFWGDEEVFEATAEFTPCNIFLLNMPHLLRSARYLPSYATRKTFRLLKFWRKNSYRQHTSRWKYNEQGDMMELWNDFTVRTFAPPGHQDSKIYALAVRYLARFISEVEQKGGRAIILPPCTRDEFFDALQTRIANIEMAFSTEGIGFAVPPIRYRMSNDCFSDPRYHMNGRGVGIRTSLIVEDIKNNLPRPRHSGGGVVDKIGSAFLRTILLRMKELGVNQTELAKRLNVSRPYITKDLRGDVNFTFATAGRFARALEMDFFPELRKKNCRKEDDLADALTLEKLKEKKNG